MLTTGRGSVACEGRVPASQQTHTRQVWSTEAYAGGAYGIGHATTAGLQDPVGHVLAHAQGVCASGSVGGNVLQQHRLICLLLVCAVRCGRGATLRLGSLQPASHSGGPQQNGFLSRKMSHECTHLSFSA
eukprot:scaffold7885_cov403-Prasinococcus_capsulatus_cf.AAC.8